MPRSTPRHRVQMAQTSFTSIPPQQRAAVERIARRRRVRLWQIYEEAVTALAKRQEAGEPIEWQPSRGEGGTPYNVRLPVEMIEEIRRIAESEDLKATTVFLTALADYLKPKP